MVRVKLKCIMGCPGLNKSYREKGILGRFNMKKKLTFVAKESGQVIYRLDYTVCNVSA